MSTEIPFAGTFASGGLIGTPIRETRLVREGSIVYMFGAAYMGPRTRWSLARGGRWPSLSRYCRGVREMEQDRRRQR